MADIVQPWQYKIPQEEWKNLAPGADISQIANALISGQQAGNAAKLATYDMEAHRLAVSPKKVVKYDSKQPEGEQITPVGEVPAGGEMLPASMADKTGQFYTFDPVTKTYIPSNVPTGATANKIERSAQPAGNRFGQAMTPEEKTWFANEVKNERMPAELISKMAGFGGSHIGQVADIVMEANKSIDEDNAAGKPHKDHIDLAEFYLRYKTASSIKVRLLQSNFDTVANEITKLKDLNEKVPIRGAIPSLNKASLAIQRFFGGEGATEFTSAVGLFKDSLSTILANGTMTDNRLKIAQEALSPDMSPENFEKVLDDVVKVFVEYRVKPVGEKAGIGEQPTTPSGVNVTPTKDGKFKVTY